MAVKIVTDSLSDITSDIAEEMGITVIPLTVFFGHESYLDRITISTDEFYHRLVHGTIWPTTTQPPPHDFTNAYNELTKETDEILVITLSSKLSGTYQSALGGIEAVEKKCRIEVIDSETVAMALGLIAISAAKKAQTGVSLDEMVDFVHRAKERCHFIAYFDTLKYLAKGGRIGKAQGLLGSVLSVKPILTTKEGEMSPLTRVRSMNAGLDYLCNAVSEFKNIELAAIEHSTSQEGADTVYNHLCESLPKDCIYRSTVSPVLGVYGGPNAVALSVLASEG